ncbi:unnamed protein product, partial [marine sediment metagenome]
MRTFHTGGVVGTDITSGLPRVEELFEARIPKASAIISEIDGNVEVIDTDEGNKVRITSSEFCLDEYELSPGMKAAVDDGQLVDVGTILLHPVPPSEETEERDTQLPAIAEQRPIVARVAGEVVIEDGRFYIKYEEREEREYIVPHGTRLLVKTGSKVKAGEQLTEGIIDPHDILQIIGKEAVQRHLIDEIQKVYRSQGVNIHDKHIAIIAC